MNWRLNACDHADMMLSASAMEGDIVLMDMRLMHQGSANRSPHVRPAMYVPLQRILTHVFTTCSVLEYTTVATSYVPLVHGILRGEGGEHSIISQH